MEHEHEESGACDFGGENGLPEIPICPGCLAPCENDPDFCPACGYPLGNTTTIDPMKRIGAYYYFFRHRHIYAWVMIVLFLAVSVPSCMLTVLSAVHPEVEHVSLVAAAAFFLACFLMLCVIAHILLRWYDYLR